MAERRRIRRRRWSSKLAGKLARPAKEWCLVTTWRGEEEACRGWASAMRERGFDYERGIGEYEDGIRS